MRSICALATAVVLVSACAHKSKTAVPQATAFGTAIVVSSGDKQIASIGAVLDQPVAVQVNDAQGTAVPGAPVTMEAIQGVNFVPQAGVTDSGGQFTTIVSLGPEAGRYQLTAVTRDSTGKRIDTKLQEIALGYQQTLGQQLNNEFCDRCHNPESTPERVSNYDNLTTKPHPFTEGDTLNKLTEQDLASVIAHGGPAIGRSPEMPPWGSTLNKSDINALVAYIRAVSDPPYQTKGFIYAKTR